jgi:putative addiction module component (TIGR02574 family)
MCQLIRATLVTGVLMADLTPQASELLQQALSLSSQERGLLIDRLIESLDQHPADAEVDKLWADEIKRRIDDVRSGRVEMIAGEETRRRLAHRLLHGRE